MAHSCEKAHRLLRGEVILRAGPGCLIGGEGSQTGCSMPQVSLAPEHHVETSQRSCNITLEDAVGSSTSAATTSAVPFLSA